MPGSNAAKSTPPPGDVGPSPTARRLIDLLRPHTPFAEAIVKRQVERAGLVFSTVDEADLATLGPLVFAASSVFLDPPVREALKHALKLRG